MAQAMEIKEIKVVKSNKLKYTNICLRMQRDLQVQYLNWIISWAIQLVPKQFPALLFWKCKGGWLRLMANDIVHNNFIVSERCRYQGGERGGDDQEICWTGEWCAWSSTKIILQPARHHLIWSFFCHVKANSACSGRACSASPEASKRTRTAAPGLGQLHQWCHLP